MTTKLTHDDLLALPKIDLHRHIDGSIRPDFLFKTAQEVGVKLPTDNLAEFTKLYQITDKSMSVQDMLKRFGWAIAVMRSHRGLYRVAREYALDLARENIFYSELRFAPGYESIFPPPWYVPQEYEAEPFPTMSLFEIVKQVLGGLEKGIKDAANQGIMVKVNVILSIPRESLQIYGQKSVEAVIQLARRFEEEGVVGIDLVCDEATYSPDPYAKLFQSTLNSRLKRDPHGGEMGADPQRLKNIEACFSKLSADGIGHAIPLHKSPYLMTIARANNIRVERTPLSPVPGCSLADGHLDVLLKNKVPVVISSDDPVLMQASLTDNWLAALDYHNFGEQEFWQMTANAVNTAFYRNEEQKNEVHKLFVAKGLSPSLLTRLI